VLAFDDAAFAKLCIAATAVPRNRRRQWLRELANRVEPPPSSPGARYTAAWRRRGRTGRIQLKLEVDEAETVVGLVDCNLLDPLRAEDRGAITEAAQRALALYLAGEGSRHDERLCDTLRAELGLDRVAEGTAPCLEEAISKIVYWTASGEARPA
jgi:hypothetical protein